ncbi:flagella biosynthesis chaperone FliJ [Verticiella sediminum]|uniref:Flagellar FliJ protein n=1 Tax=Verticiella sediminum TaxID=1247510 RepID=A0A556ARV9_9BURK|nr:flagellar export protein FliJ [Verticiella sediminum]TSH95663.1 flagella biosynthesis chaperone FliJ [Verticiella sediminum]
MAKPQPLDTLVELATEKVDTAARELGLLQGRRQEAERQLRMLEQYLADYRTRLQQSIQQGLSAAAWQNYQRFIVTLEAAIGEQQGVLAHAEAQLDDGRRNWQQHKTRLNAYDTLLERREQAIVIQTGRREQRATDEVSARLARRQHMEKRT